MCSSVRPSSPTTTGPRKKPAPSWPASAITPSSTPRNSACSPGSPPIRTSTLGASACRGSSGRPWTSSSLAPLALVADHEDRDVIAKLVGHERPRRLVESISDVLRVRRADSRQRVTYAVLPEHLGVVAPLRDAVGIEHQRLTRPE